MAVKEFGKKIKCVWEICLRAGQKVSLFFRSTDIIQCLNRQFLRKPHLLLMLKFFFSWQARHVLPRWQVVKKSSKNPIWTRWSNLSLLGFFSLNSIWRIEYVLIARELWFVFESLYKKFLRISSIHWWKSMGDVFICYALQRRASLKREHPLIQKSVSISLTHKSIIGNLFSRLCHILRHSTKTINLLRILS